MLKKTLYADGLNLDLEEKAEETIIHCSGQLTKRAAQWFHTEIRDRVIPISRGKQMATTSLIVLNFSQTSFIDSAGLAAILCLWTDRRKSGCEVEIANQRARTPQLNESVIRRLLRKLKT